MTVTDIEKENCTLRLTFDEIMIFNNALNEVCNGLNLSDFSTRMGGEINEVKNLLQEVHKIYSEMWQIQDEYSNNSEL